ncbi:unnamed protein product [Mycena citricolor]|uniref:Uncharacterized protein n=1 Tax=Mycena citricolor TaxID=2018698 RepID=A0AAD2Q5Z2_9AGAR|nr:unnamed protein product [Mycena citricolor]
MHIITSPVPAISISFVTEDVSPEEPKSPFSWTSSPIDEDDDGFRPRLLTPPPTSSPRSVKPLSPLRPVNAEAPAGKGLERERFEALLQASKERNSVVGGTRKINDLRKEIALKVHNKKQVERRALFLSKVLAPPSPTATLLPKTPPESPAIFNYTLPSPGLVSPLALFDSLNDDPAFGPLSKRECWVEQVDFRLPEKAKVKDVESVHARKAKPLPSLDQISARMAGHAHVHINASSERKPRLPAFLVQARPSVPRLTTSVGRLQLPVRREPAIPLSPSYPLSPKLQVTTLVVPRSSSTSPVELTEMNLNTLNSREKRAKDMLSALKRRTEHSAAPLQAPSELRHWKRRSAPAELSPRARTGFEHPVLCMPGGF